MRRVSINSLKRKIHGLFQRYCKLYGQRYNWDSFYMNN